MNRIVMYALVGIVQRKGNKLRSDDSKESGSCLYRNRVNVEYYYTYSVTS